MLDFIIQRAEKKIYAQLRRYPHLRCFIVRFFCFLIALRVLLRAPPFTTVFAVGNAPPGQETIRGAILLIPWEIRKLHQNLSNLVISLNLSIIAANASHIDIRGARSVV